MKHILLIIVLALTISIAISAKENNNTVNKVNLQNNPTLVYSSPHGTNIDSKYNKSIVPKVEQEADSTAKNEIVSLYSPDQIKFYVGLQLTEYNVRIKLHVFNMLGNLVKEAFVGIATKDVEYDFDASNLPNGLYLCILEGPNFRDAEKFTISR